MARFCDRVSMVDVWTELATGFVAGTGSWVSMSVVGYMVGGEYVFQARGLPGSEEWPASQHP